MEATKNYIKQLNRSTLVEYLIEQKFAIEAHILQSKDIDGERFLNFTELDLVHWGIKANQKKILLDCRKKILASGMPPKQAVPKKPKPILANTKLKQNTISNAVLNQNQNTIPTIIRTQKLLPAPPANVTRSDSTFEQRHDVSKRSTRQSAQYVDMTQVNTELEENLDYVDMTLGMQSKAEDNKSSKLAPKVPERPKQFNRNGPGPSRDLLSELMGRQHASKKTNVPLKGPVQQNLGFPKSNGTPDLISLDIDEMENYLEPNSICPSKKTNGLLKGPVQQNLGFFAKSDGTREAIFSEIDEMENYLEPEPICSALEYPNRTDFLQDDREGCPPLPPRHVIKDFSVNESTIYDESIYEADPLFESKLSTIKHPKRPSIQDMALPPIPNQTSIAKVTFSPLPTLPNRTENLPYFIPPAPNENSNLLSKPIIRQTPDNWRTRPDFFNTNMAFDDMDLAPPPPGFGDVENISSVASNKELPVANPHKARNKRNLHVSELPRPPVFNRLNEQDQITRLRDLLHDDDTPSSEDEDTFNPNSCIYYRNTDRKGAKLLLERMKQMKMLKNGTFLMRPSMHGSYFLGLTVFHNGEYYNLGIYKDSQGKYYGQSLNESDIVKFFNLDEFVNYYEFNALTVKKKDGRIMELFLKYYLPSNVF